MSPSRRTLIPWRTVMLVGLAIAGGCVAAVPDGEPGENTEDNNLTFEEWLPTVYQEADTGVWIVDGDTPIVEERELREFFINHVQPGALIVHQSGGVDAKWSDT